MAHVSNMENFDTGFRGLVLKMTFFATPKKTNNWDGNNIKSSPISSWWCTSGQLFRHTRKVTLWPPCPCPHHHSLKQSSIPVCHNRALFLLDIWNEICVSKLLPLFKQVYARSAQRPPDTLVWRFGLTIHAELTKSRGRVLFFTPHNNDDHGQKSKKLPMIALFPPNSNRHFPNLSCTARATLFPTWKQWAL